MKLPGDPARSALEYGSAATALLIQKKGLSAGATVRNSKVRLNDGDREEQGKPKWKPNMSPVEAAQVIERFLAETELYPFEWTNFPRRHNRIQGRSAIGGAATNLVRS